MDHFPIFGALLKGFVKLELSELCPYDNNGYNNFPLRIGFSEREITEGLFCGVSTELQHDPETYASLIQSWFWWGLLHDFLQEPLDKECFLETLVDSRQLLTTAKLGSRLSVWAENLSCKTLPQAAQQVQHASDILGRTLFLVTTLSVRLSKASEVQNGDANTQYWKEHGSDIFPEDLEMAIAALGYTLIHALRAMEKHLNLHTILGRSARESQEAAIWHTPRMLTEYLKLCQFCNSDMFHFKDDGRGFILSCMAATLPGLARSGNHSDCSAHECVVENIIPHAYKRRHVTGCHECPSTLDDTVRQDILNIIESGAIPVLRVLNSDVDPSKPPMIEVSAFKAGIDYVAFSHVWADGRGNQVGNDMYQCQWHWLQQCVQLCERTRLSNDSSEHKVPLAFWIDTVCVPRGQGSRPADLRSQAITMMPEIYRSAKHVIVLDSALETMGYVSNLEFAMRLKFCTWSRRVWTLHEGAVARNVLVQTKHGLASVLSMIKRFATAKYPAHTEQGWDLLASIEQDYILALLPATLMIYSFDRSIESTFTLSWKELAKRTTSIPNDRYLVLGIMNRVAPEVLISLQRNPLDHADTAAAHLAKLESFLRATSVLPQSIIFTSEERFEKAGMRWAPGRIGAEIPYDESSNFIQSVTARGALVTYNGWHIHSSLHEITHTSHVRFDIAESQHSKAQTFLVAVYPTDKKRASFATIPDLFKRQDRLAMILSDVPNPENKYMGWNRALLVKVCDMIIDDGNSPEGEGKPKIQVEYIAVMRIMVEPNNDDDDDDDDENLHVKASWVDEGVNQEWFVG